MSTQSNQGELEDCASAAARRVTRASPRKPWRSEVLHDPSLEALDQFFGPPAVDFGLLGHGIGEGARQRVKPLLWRLQLRAGNSARKCMLRLRTQRA